MQLRTFAIPYHGLKLLIRAFSLTMTCCLLACGILHSTLTSLSQLVSRVNVLLAAGLSIEHIVP